MNSFLFSSFFFCLLMARAVSEVRTIQLVNRIHSAAERREFRKILGKHPKAVKGGRFYFSNYPRDYIAMNISIGTPAQHFTVSVESGQMDSWVLGTDMQPLAPGQPTYDDSASSTSQYSDYFEGSSGNYQVYGDLYKDVLKIGTNIIIKSQKFGDVDEVYNTMEATSFGSSDLSGVMGIAYYPDDLDDRAVIVNIFKSTNITKRQFTLWLGSPKPPAQGNPDATLTLGGVDDVHCSTSVDYVEVGADDLLQFVVFRFASGSYYSDGEQIAYVDTGFPTIAFSSDIYDALFQQINPDYDWDLGLLTTPCQSIDTLPGWVFSIGTKEYTVPPIFYVLDVEIDGGVTCAVSLELLDTDNTDADLILGNPFARSVCTVCDLDKSLIGFTNTLG